jgi:hypothetical protein
MPILGIMASSMQGAVGDYESIQTVTVGAGGQATISFTSIASNYKHLQIRYMACWTGTSINYSQPYIRFNSDSTASYSTHSLYGTGSSTGGNGAASITEGYLGWIPDSNYANTFGVGVVDLLDYQNTSKYKTVRTLGGYSRNFNASANELIGLISSSWQKTNAVTSITIAGAGNFAQYSSFALYGIR